MAGLASLYPARDDLPLVREDGPPVARGLGVFGAQIDGLAVGDTCFALGTVTGKVWFRARLLRVRATYPQFFVEYIADLTGNSSALALPTRVDRVANAWTPPRWCLLLSQCQLGPLPTTVVAPAPPAAALAAAAPSFGGGAASTPSASAALAERLRLRPVDVLSACGSCALISSAGTKLRRGVGSASADELPVRSAMYSTKNCG